MEGSLTDAKPATLDFEKFRAVEDLLNCNKILISEINSNHEARTPEGLARNTILIRELNKNVAQVVQLYKEISSCVVSLGKAELPLQQQQAGQPS